MAKIILEKSRPLTGEIEVSGAKNAVLPLMAATLLVEEPCVIEDVPDLKDVYVMNEVLRELGAEVFFNVDEKTLRVETRVIKKTEAPYELMSKMRASFLVMGPLLARKGEARIALPGGCSIGARPIDLHLKGFEKLGAVINIGHGFVEGKVDGGLRGGNIYLDFPSVGATENILMAAVLAEGTTLIENAAQEPEITDLSNFLNKMGANISGAGTSNIRIKGVKSLHGTNHQVIPDRIEAGTYMVAAAITRGNLLVKNVLSNHMRPMIAKLEEAGVKMEFDDDNVRVDATMGFKGVDITTLPYPGFPTDMQAQFMAMLAVTPGIHVIMETVFENRFMHVNELNRMGANIKIEGSSAIIQGIEQLEGTTVKATDLRAGAALILAGLVAEGKTEILDIYHVDRGFVNIERKLQAVGANIYRVD
ncbi:MAG: UDP-N-acetylglucosamine 1-carboxyvinyltransferase [delta proteobacterium ML8_F1]|nr:MAG: UDP-N-acetylglucosamine 1-carboxyvinyltransferase [delta proteobacterium ML8_F1]